MTMYRHYTIIHEGIVCIALLLMGKCDATKHMYYANRHSGCIAKNLRKHIMCYYYENALSVSSLYAYCITFSSWHFSVVRQKHCIQLVHTWSWQTGHSNRNICIAFSFVEQLGHHACFSCCRCFPTLALCKLKPMLCLLPLYCSTVAMQ